MESLPYLFVQETSTSMFLVMEYCNGGDLADYLHGKLFNANLQCVGPTDVHVHSVQ